MRKTGSALLLCVLCAVGLSAQSAEELRRATALFQQGLKLQEAGQCDAAIQRYSDYIKIRPGRASVYYNRGLCYFRQLEVDKAIADLSKAIEIDS
ncbi:MAG: tetratricopeptide repeat protein, partial [Pyrinomonadaceae bacterium]